MQYKKKNALMTPDAHLLHSVLLDSASLVQTCTLPIASLTFEHRGVTWYFRRDFSVKALLLVLGTENLNNLERRIMIEIPVERLNEDTLTAIIEEYVTRESTEYGDREYSLSEKITQVRKQLNSRSAVILFDEATESCLIVPSSQLPRP